MQELRLEDYLAGRKGPTGGMVGGGLVGNQMGSLGLGGGGGGLGGGIGGGGLFGQQNKTLGGGELPDIQAVRHSHTCFSFSPGLGGTGLFSGQQQQSQGLGGGGLFGTQPKPTGGLFGATPGQNKGLGGGLGGGLGTGGGLFSQQQVSQSGGLFGNPGGGGGGLFSQAGNVGQSMGLGGLGGQPGVSCAMKEVL